MLSRSANYRLFLQEFRRTFHSTGAVLPSGRRLCRPLAKYVPGNDGRPRRILEVGPGTGVATDAIIRGLGPNDTLELVELNDRFVESLRGRLTGEPAWQAVASRVTIHHMPVENLHPDEPYDAIVCGLPFNNFPAEVVRSILDHLSALVAPHGTLSFFEYIAVRKAKALIAKTEERKRLVGVEGALATVRRRQFDRDCVLLNVPPAWVHHMRFE